MAVEFSRYFSQSEHSQRRSFGYFNPSQKEQRNFNLISDEYGEDKMIRNQLIDLQEHCFKLLDLLGQLHPEAFSKTIDWLDIAAGVESVKVTTAKHDDTVAYCGTAMAYEDKRSELLSNLATRLTIFNFVWGSFESVAKTLLGNKKRGIVKKTTKFLKQNYSPRPPIAFYEANLNSLHGFVRSSESYEVGCDDFKLTEFVDRTGLGLHVVREIRNDLAHGSVDLPRPDRWGRGDTHLLSSERRHLDLIDTCTRIILLTVQMLLFTHVQGKGIIVECLLDEEGDIKESTAENALDVIHLEPILID